MGVATRTKTGVMVKAKYDNTTLRLLGERRSHDARGTLSKRIIKMTKIDKCKGKAFEEPKPDLGFEAKELDRSLPYPNIVDITGGVDFIPPTAFGEIHEGASGMGLSAIGRANRKIEQWEIIRAAHAKHLPKVLPQIDVSYVAMFLVIPEE